MIGNCGPPEPSPVHTDIYCEQNVFVLGTLSIARAIAQHESNDPTSLNFSNGKDIRVTTKLDNPHSELWGGEVT